MSLKGTYNISKEAKVGTLIECPICHTHFNKLQYNQAFCCSKCKDKYHNIVSGDRHYNNFKVVNRTIDIDDIDKVGDFKGVENFNSANVPDYKFIENVRTIGQLKKVLDKFDDDVLVMTGTRMGEVRPILSSNFVLYIHPGKDCNNCNCLFL